MRYALICFILLFGTVSVEPSWAAEKSKASPVVKKRLKGTTGVFDATPGAIALTESDCRLDGGTVVKPGDSRCGSLGAVYCRKANGEAACINEQ